MNSQILIALPNNYLIEDVDSKVGILENCASQPSRKRRLDHLSWEEKMQRKKLKNRVAAQTSRDRKKAKMDEMELRIENLENKNEELLSDVASLKALNERLLSENSELKKQIATGHVVEGSLGPAESKPQQKVDPPAACRVALLLMCLLSRTSSNTSAHQSTLTSCKALPTSSYTTLMQIVKEKLHPSKLKTLDNALKEAKWWGPHQSTWNPLGVRS